MVHLSGLHWRYCRPRKNLDKHVHKLRVVLHKLREACLWLNVVFFVFQKQAGHTVRGSHWFGQDREGAAWPQPTELQRFLGLASYFCHFIRNSAQIAKPLHQLTEDFQYACSQRLPLAMKIKWEDTVLWLQLFKSEPMSPLLSHSSSRVIVSLSISGLWSHTSLHLVSTTQFSLSLSLLCAPWFNSKVWSN